MNKEGQLSTAIWIASSEFVNIFDKGGNPYILHCLYVMRKVRYHSIDAMIVGVLHDVLEDTSMSKGGLVSLGIERGLVKVVDLLTKKEGQTYEEYKEAVKSHPLAVIVKLADLEHNMKLSRIKNKGNLKKKDIERINNYIQFYSELEQIKKNNLC